MADGGELMRMLLVWFQAERTMPNPHVIAGDEFGSHKIRMADAFGWPADSKTWQRLIAFLLQRAAVIPRHLRPSMITVFDVWQNAFFPIRNDTSSRILQQCEAWLDEVDAVGADQNGGPSGEEALGTTE